MGILRILLSDSGVFFGIVIHVIEINMLLVLDEARDRNRGAGAGMVRDEVKGDNLETVPLSSARLYASPGVLQMTTLGQRRNRPAWNSGRRSSSRLRAQTAADWKRP
jgi:hypothetical protein